METLYAGDQAEDAFLASIKERSGAPQTQHLQYFLLCGPGSTVHKYAQCGICVMLTYTKSVIMSSPLCEDPSVL